MSEASAVVRSVQGNAPQIPDSCWVAPYAVVTGEVSLGERCTIWYHAVLRGDVGAIRIGNNVNIQDGAIVHSTHGKSTVTLADNVSIGHRAIVHGCDVGENSLIGMGAIVMDNAVVEANAIVAAGAVVLENTVVPSGTIWAGVPAKQVKQLDPEVLGKRTALTAEAYVKYKDWYQAPQMPEG